MQMKLQAALRGIPLAGCVIGSLLASFGGPVEAADAATAALKQISKATEGLRGVVADVEYSEIVDKRSMGGSGKLYFHDAGLMRIEIGGDEPGTVLFRPPLLYIHRHADRVVEIYDVTSNPHRLAQYVGFGFAPTGTALKKQFDVDLFQDTTLDGKAVQSFLLVPKPKKAKAIAVAVGGIQLWIDPQSGLPVQQRIVHAQGLSELRVRYLDVTREDELPDSLFQPEWPAGVETVRK
jgi:outer membrane lipoprotein-sorting protein